MVSVSFRGTLLYSQAADKSSPNCAKSQGSFSARRFFEPALLCLEEGIRELPRIEVAQVVDRLADTNITHRQGEFMADRHNDAAFGGAIQFSQGDTGHSSGILE